MNVMANVLHTQLGIAPESSEAAVLQLLIELGAQVVGAAEGSLLVHDPGGKDLVFAMTVGGGTGLIGKRVPLGQGLTGLAAATREVQIGAPTFQIGQSPESRAAQRQPQAVIAAPMLADDELIGVLTAVCFDDSKRFGAQDGDLYGRLACVAGLVVHQRQQLAALQAANGASENAKSIAGSVARLSASNPDALARVARLLLEIEGLVGPTPGPAGQGAALSRPLRSPRSG